MSDFVPCWVTLMEALTINASKAKLTDDQFFDICHQNEGLRFELTAHGELIIMPPVSGDREMCLGAKVWIWNDANRFGRVFSSSTVCRLPNGAKRTLDVAWVDQGYWDGCPVPRSAGAVPTSSPQLCD